MLPGKVLPRVCIARAAVYIATDIQYHIFNFQICLPWLFTKKRAYSAHIMSTYSNLLAMVIYKKELIVHIQCLLTVDGSIVAGVFLTSFFCVVPESPYSSGAASSSLLAAWYSNCFRQLVAPVASETGGCSPP